MKISIVIPTYNEEKRIGKTIETVENFLKKLGQDFEVIVADDGSQDLTVETVKQVQKKYNNLVLLEEKHKGKGLTVKAGMEKASGDIVLFTDADLATPISEFEKFEEKFATGADIVIGSRGIKREGAPLIRWIMAWGLNFLAKIILRLNFADTQCGFKAFRKETLRKILPKLKIYSGAKETSGSRVTASFDLELLFLAKKLKFKTREVLIVWEHKASKAVRPGIESLATLVDIFKIRFYSLVGGYS